MQSSADTFGGARIVHNFGAVANKQYGMLNRYPCPTLKRENNRDIM
jgi:hypothetical protein